MRSSLLCSSLLVALAAASPAFAAVSVMSGDPPADLASLISAERKFAARAAETSIRDAFFEAMDDQAIVFRPGPVNAKEFFRGRPSNPGPLRGGMRARGRGGHHQQAIALPSSEDAVPSSGCEESP